MVSVLASIAGSSPCSIIHLEFQSINHVGTSFRRGVRDTALCD